jgi:hypothetical protein
MRSIVFALSLLFATPAHAQSDEAFAACFTEIPLTAALVAETGQYDYGGFAGAAGVPAFVTGYLSPTRSAEDAQDVFGTVIFIRDSEGAWRAVLPRVGEGLVRAYANGEGGIIIATMWTSEGPGGEWMLMRSTDGLRTATCGDVEFPEALNQPTWANEFLSLHDLDITRRGRGEIIGVARTENRGDLWFAYQTRDHGATWRAPRRISRERQARRGIYTKVDEDEAPAALVAELTAYAAGL